MRIASEGQIGDMVYALGICNELRPWKHTLLLQCSNVTGWKSGPSFEKACEVLLPLLQSQAYIEEARIIQSTDHVDWYSGGFRDNGGALHSKEHTLLQAHVSHLTKVKKIGHGIKGHHRWLYVRPSPQSKDRVVISRSTRYTNMTFPWKQIVKFYGDRLLFVGLPSEYDIFCNAFGRVQYLKTDHMLHVAEVIEGSLLGIFNQSSPNAICEGLKHRSIQEVSLGIPDCIFKRPNAQYVYNGNVTLPNFDGGEDLILPPYKLADGMVTTKKAPSGKWQFPNSDIVPHVDFEHVINQARRKFPGKNKEQLEKELLEHTMIRLPDLGVPSGQYTLAKQALKNAGY